MDWMEADVDPLMQQQARLQQIQEAERSLPKAAGFPSSVPTKLCYNSRQ